LRNTRQRAFARAAAGSSPAAEARLAASAEDMTSCTDGLGQEALTATATFDSGLDGGPYSVTIRFSGRRLGVTGKPQPGDAFVQLEAVEAVLPGSGPIAITSRIDNVNRGEWAVTAVVHKQEGRRRLVRPWPMPAHNGSRGAGASAWWRKGAIPIGSTARLRSGLAPLAPVPGTVRGSWATLVGLGVVVGVSIQSSILVREHVDIATTIALSLTAALAGLIASKAWFLTLHRGSWRGFVQAGMCIQGFLVGVAASLAIALGVTHIPLNSFLDATAPALFFGMAVGRPGCFLAGCCAGRPVSSRWGLWASDRRVGVRRIPIQLIESGVCLLIGLGTLELVLGNRVGVPGAVVVAALAAYTLLRQFLLPLRAEPRKTSLGRVLTISVAALVLVPDLALILFANG
jgi:phosphatidylglycerol---prolipoprotein diacylglyceryl transferase